MTGQEVTNEAKDDTTLTTRILPSPSHIPYKIYDSTLLDDKYKPNPDQLELPPDLELLKPLILLQHVTFTSTLKELGTISTMQTKVINKKKDSYHQLKNNNKIPISLRLKCPLTTTPSYAENTDFLRIKETLDNKISTFIKEGSDLMTEWAAINIQLLITDHCQDILQKALKILNSLIAYTSDVIGTPSWPPVADKNPMLLLLKFYFSNKLFNIDDLVDYFKPPPKKMLIIAAAIINISESEEETTTLLESLNIADIDFADELRNIYVRETLLHFDQIL